MQNPEISSNVHSMSVDKNWQSSSQTARWHYVYAVTKELLSDKSNRGQRPLGSCLFPDFPFSFSSILIFHLRFNLRPIGRPLSISPWWLNLTLIKSGGPRCWLDWVIWSWSSQEISNPSQMAVFLTLNETWNWRLEGKDLAKNLSKVLSNWLLLCKLQCSTLTWKEWEPFNFFWSSNTQSSSGSGPAWMSTETSAFCL